MVCFIDATMLDLTSPNHKVTYGKAVSYPQQLPGAVCSDELATPIFDRVTVFPFEHVTLTVTVLVPNPLESDFWK